MKNWQVYILRCGDGTLYTGITNDLEQRLKAHNEKRGARYTRTRLPVTLVYQEEAASRSQASRREITIKKLPRHKKLELIAASADNIKYIYLTKISPIR
jgi:putative endonuclease